MVIDIKKQTLTYWRNPTQDEIKFGYGALHYIEVPISRALKPDGKPRKSLKWDDGLMYYY